MSKQYIIAGIIILLAAGLFFGLKSKFMAPEETPDTGSTAVKKVCVTGGCSGELCVEKGSDAVSSCIWEDTYACFKAAKCEVQSNGNCGWTQTNELEQCLNSKVLGDVFVK